KAEILAIAIIPMLGTKILIHERFFTFIKPKKLDAKSIKIHGIDIETIKDAPEFGEIARKILEKVEDTIIVGCDTGFDIAVLKKHFSKQKLKFDPKFIDIIQIERFLSAKEKKRVRIDTFEDILHIYKYEDSYRHSALADAYYSAQIFQLQLKKLISLGISIDKLLEIGRRKESFVPFYLG
ncbi:MAG: hypothetical protein DRO65_00475, partial [Candidatus Altiarchaeales archaeon]